MSDNDIKANPSRYGRMTAGLSDGTHMVSHSNFGATLSWREDRPKLGKRNCPACLAFKDGSTFKHLPDPAFRGYCCYRDQWLTRIQDQSTICQQFTPIP